MEGKPKAPLCNLCGEPCGCEDDSALGLVNHSIKGRFRSTPGNGYGALDDMTMYEFSLCEFCIDWLFCQFKAPPRTAGYDAYTGEEDGDAEPFRPAARRVNEDEWRRFKEQFFEQWNLRNAKRGSVAR